MKDYAAIDAELDDELRNMYPTNSEAMPDDSEDDTSEEPDLSPDEPEPELPESTPNEEALESPAEEAAEATVPESKYHAAVVRMNEAMQEAAQLRKQLASSPTDNLSPPETDAMPESNPEAGDFETAMAGFRDDFPEFASVLDALKSEVDALKGETGKFKPIADEFEANKQKAHNEAYWNTIKDVHPDVAEIGDSAEYAEWYHAQPEEMQNQLVSGDPQDVIDGLNAYRAAVPAMTAEPEPEAEPEAAISIAIKPDAPALEDEGEEMPEADLEDEEEPDNLAMAKAAASPALTKTGKPGQTKAFTRAQIDKMSDKEYAANEAAIDEQMAKGLIK